MLSQPGRIPGAQVYPFYLLEKELRQRWGVEVREMHLQTFLGATRANLRADVVLFQGTVHAGADELKAWCQAISERTRASRLVYLDWFAPTDLRHAHPLADHVDLYVKKHLLRDRTQYGRPTMGDTNLEDHFRRRLGLPAPTRCWPIPEHFLESKLVLGPNFALAPEIVHRLRRALPRLGGARPIDVHARLTTDGSDWYEAMRTECMDALATLEGVHCLTKTGVPWRAYMRELASSKLCYSPFGYGEICWRDVEAMVQGTALLKPDCGHLELEPRLLIAGTTYASLQWDASDLLEKVTVLLGDRDQREHLARSARAHLREHLGGEGTLKRFAPLFG